MLLQSPSVSKGLLFQLIGIHSFPDHTAFLVVQATARVAKVQVGGGGTAV